MARTIAEIQAGMIATKAADTSLSGLTSTSQSAIWLLWTWVVATAQWTLEQLFDAHKNEVASIISTQKPHTLQWYVAMAKAYQKGITLPPDTDVYPLVPPADPSVLIVAYAAAVELIGIVRIKVAKSNSGSLAKLGTDLPAFQAYMTRIKDAGVRLQITSDDPDTLQLALGIYYDPLILDNTGARLDGTSATPVKDAIRSFLENLPFNGLFVLNYLIKALQSIEGVRIGEVVTAQAQYGLLPYTNIPVEYLPDSGYMALDETFFDANITYTAHTPI
ncbi:MAG: hypothetical protein JWQ38_192 [Flavipsychrobacter sp.]|nr:hypothetical protein [Flavipsychrobacter sp.]